jgi:predicted carbohydrate-binding protein with CBM5 and CBM33 domain
MATPTIKFTEFNRDIKSLYDFYKLENAYNTCSQNTLSGTDVCPQDTENRTMNEINRILLNTRLPYNQTGYENDVTALKTKTGTLRDNTDHKDLLDKHNEVKALRKDLDNKVNELRNTEKTDNQILHDNSVYVTLTWTVLATSVLYYLFVKL